MTIIIYTAQTCPYCDQAKKLLEKKRVNYETIDITNDSEQRHLMVEKSNGLRTVPQVFINDQHIGGFDNLQNLDIQGKLDILIQSYIKTEV